MDCSCPELGSGGPAGLQPAVLLSLPTELPGIKLLNVIYLWCLSFAEMCRHLLWELLGIGSTRRALLSLGGQGGCPTPRAALGAATAVKSGRIAPVFNYLIEFFHTKFNWDSKEGAVLEDRQGICICFADYSSCTFYFKHQWAATAIQMIWKLVLYTEISLKQQRKGLAHGSASPFLFSFSFY